MTTDVYVKFETTYPTQVQANKEVQYYLDVMRISGVSIIDRTTNEHLLNLVDDLVCAWVDDAGDAESSTKRIEARKALESAIMVQPTTPNFEQMFMAACSDLGAINEALGLDPDDGGAEPIIDAIEDLKAAKTLAQPAPAQSVVPAGWKLIPIEISQEMVDSADDFEITIGIGYGDETQDVTGYLCSDDLREIYKLLIAATPTPPVEAQRDERGAIIDQPTCAPWIPSKEFISAFIRSIAELPGRSSPEGDPDALVVSADELTSALLSTAESFGENAARTPESKQEIAPLLQEIVGIAFDGRLEKGDRLMRIAVRAEDYLQGRRTFQDRVQPWMLECFGAKISADKLERNHRFFEEATELVQACGMTANEAHQLVDYTFNRPVGEPRQEVGGVMVTLAALCLARDLNMHGAGEIELARIWTKVPHIRAKQAAKPKHSPLPEAIAKRAELATVSDLAGLIGRLVYALRRAAPDHVLPAVAMDYLRRKNLLGSPLRDDVDPEASQTSCNWQLQAEGKPYPRTCSVCLHGPCSNKQFIKKRGAV